MSSNNQNSKLLLTAAGSAIAGGLAAVALMKFCGKKDDNDNSPRYDHVPRRQSFQIFEDPEQMSESQKILYPFNHEEKMRLKVAARQAVEEDNSLPRNSVTVRVPATSANMGPGCEYIKSADNK